MVAGARREWEEKQRGYRMQALKILPWVCAHCGREFSGKRLRELTVHHKDHNHQNNPPDGSNWELLCVYCHENEHSRQEAAEAFEAASPTGKQAPASTYQPFADLGALLKKRSS
jgi:hypothetical protein